MDNKLGSALNPTDTNGKSAHPKPSGNSNQTTEDDQWDLGWLSAVFQRRGWLMAQVALGTTLLAGGLFLFTTKLTPSVYKGKFQLLVEPITTDEQLARSSIRAQGATIPDEQGINIDRSTLDYESQIRILQGPKLLGSLISQVHPLYPEMTYENLIKNLEIERLTTLTLDKKPQGTKLIEVRYEDSDPHKLKLVLNHLSRIYLNYSLKERQSSIRQGIQFIDGQLPVLRQRVESLQRQIQILRQRFTIVDPEQQGKQLTETSIRLEQAEADSQTLLAEAEARHNTLSRRLNTSPLLVLSESPYDQKTLLEQYRQVDGQIAEKSPQLTPDNPIMQNLLEKRRNLKALLDQEANRVVAKSGDSVTIADARHQAITQVKADTQQKIQQLSAITLQYNALQRELSLATDSLNKFATRREALQIDAAQQEIPWELTIPPHIERNELGEFVKVNSISKVRFLALIIVLAILLGIGVGFLMEVTQDLIQTTEEVKRTTQLPLLGIIPRNQAKQTTLSPHFVEAFRSLCKNLRLFSQTYAPTRSLTVTSAQEGEGKTTIALQLAITSATMGQRVLLVDADLRHSQIHEILGLSNQWGLSNVLFGERDLAEATQTMPAYENLTVLTAGQPLLDPIELLTSERVEPLFQKLQSLYDLVIVDTPPLLGLADSGLVAAQCDSLVLVARLGKTRRPSLLAALEELKLSSTTILGIIANDVTNSVALAPSYYKLTRKAS